MHIAEILQTGNAYCRNFHAYVHTCTCNAYIHTYFRLDARSINARSILHANAYNMLTCNNKWQSKVYRCQWPKTK